MDFSSDTLYQQYGSLIHYLGLFKCILGFLQGITISNFARFVLQLLHGFLELFVLLDLLPKGLHKPAERTL